MRESHLEQIERWANYVKTNPKWRKEHDEFINSIFANHDRFLKNMLKTPEGKSKIVKLYNIKNKKGYSWL